MQPRFLLLLMGLLSCLFGCDGGDHPYHQEDGEWFYNKDKIELERGESLTPLSKHFAKSSRAAYFESAMIEGQVDVATFAVLNDHYAKDQHGVWFCDTYRSSQEYFLLKRYRTPRVEGANAASFRLLNDDYARDTNRVFYDGKGFTVRDINSYVRVGDQHAKDKVSGYFMRAEIKGSDGGTFEPLDAHYSRDGTHVYWSDFSSGGGAHAPVEESRVLSGVSPATFALLGQNYVGDAGQVLYEGKVISKTPAVFRVLERDYAVTDKQVFYRGEVLKGADVATFVLLPDTEPAATAQDKYGQFFYDKRVQQ